MGYILEVDLDYSVTLHSEHSSFPLAPERVKVSSPCLVHMLSSHMRKFIASLKFPPLITLQLLFFPK